MVEEHILHAVNVEGRHVLLRLAAIEVDLQIVLGDLAILVIDNIGDGIPQAEARHQQGGTAADADEHHQETLAVAENVPQGHLVQEAQPVPQRQVLQQDLLAGGGGLGADQLRRDLLQGAVAAVPGHRQHHSGVGQHHRRTETPVEADLNVRGDVEHAAVGVPYDLGDHRAARQHAQAAAQDAAGTGVNQVLAHDGGAGEAQGLQGSNLGALLANHAAHGGDAHQCGDEQEEHGQDPGHALDDLGVALQSGIAHIGVAVQDVGLGGFQIVDLFPGVGQFDGSVRKLCFGVGNGLLRLQLALFVFDPAVGQFRLALFQLAAAVI